MVEKREPGSNNLPNKKEKKEKLLVYVKRILINQAIVPKLQIIVVNKGYISILILLWGPHLSALYYK